MSHVVDVIFAAISEICFSRSILPGAMFEDASIRAPGSRALVKIPKTTSPKAGRKTLDGDTIARWCQELRPWVEAGVIMRVSFGFGFGSTSRILEEYIFDVCASGPDQQPSNVGSSQVVELLQSLRFLSHTFDPVDNSRGGLVAFAKAYLDPEFDSRCARGAAFQDARGDGDRGNQGVSYFEKTPFQLRIGRVHTACAHVVTLGVCSSLDSISRPPGLKAETSSLVPDNLPMCSSEDDQVTMNGGTTAGANGLPVPTPKSCARKRKAVDAPAPTPVSIRKAAKKKGRLAALHFRSESISA